MSGTTKTLYLEDPITFPCPHCGRKCITGNATEEATPILDAFDVNPKGMVLHSEPACDDYVSSDPDAFIALARQRGLS